MFGGRQTNVASLPILSGLSLQIRARMITRRNILLGVGTGVVMMPTLSACTSSTSEQDAARMLRSRMTTSASDRPQLMRELIRYATLAPSSHNTQCWRFQVFEKSIAITPDMSRRCPAVDPDDHHLFVSLGCSTENLAQPALASGLNADVRFNPSGAGRVAVNLEPTKRRDSPMFYAITSANAHAVTTTDSPCRLPSFDCSNWPQSAMACAYCY